MSTPSRAPGGDLAALGPTAHFAQIQPSDPSADQIAQGTPHPCVRYTVQTAEATQLAVRYAVAASVEVIEDLDHDLYIPLAPTTAIGAAINS